VSAEIAADRYHVTPTAARARSTGCKSKPCSFLPGRAPAGREWISDELFQLLDAFEYDIARQEMDVPIGRRQRLVRPKHAYPSRVGGRDDD